MEEVQLSTLKRIFSDAHIKDIDLSEWDKHVTLCVLADHYRDWSGGRCPLLLVRFEGVTELTVSFRHLSQPALEPGVHFQWLVDDLTAESGDDGGHVVKLAGSLKTSPVLTLAYQRTHVTEVDHRELDQRTPGWDAAHKGFARPGFASLVRL